MVEDATEELNKLTNEDEMRDAAVLVFANTLTPPRQLVWETLTDVGKNGDLWWWNAGDAGGDSAVAWSKGQAPSLGVGRGTAFKGRCRGRGQERKPVVGASRHGKMTSLLAATPGHSGHVAAGLMVSAKSWCGVVVCVCQTFSAPSRSV